MLYVVAIGIVNIVDLKSHTHSLHCDELCFWNMFYDLVKEQEKKEANDKLLGDSSTYGLKGKTLIFNIELCIGLCIHIIN